jgi:hypothetical protein
LILETDPQTVASRVTMRGADGEVPITEQVSCASCVLQELCSHACCLQELRCSMHSVCCKNCAAQCMPLCLVHCMMGS